MHGLPSTSIARPRDRRDAWDSRHCARLRASERFHRADGILPVPSTRNATAVSVPCSYSWAMRRSKARFAISASRLMMRSKFRSRLTYTLNVRLLKAVAHILASAYKRQNSCTEVACNMRRSFWPIFLRNCDLSERQTMYPRPSRNQSDARRKPRRGRVSTSN